MIWEKYSITLITSHSSDKINHPSRKENNDRKTPNFNSRRRKGFCE